MEVGLAQVAGLDPLERHHGHGGDHPVKKLPVVVLQVEIAYPLAPGDVPAELQRQSGLAGAWVPAQHHEVTRLHVDLFVKRRDAPGQIVWLDALGVPVQKLAVGLLHGGDPHAGLAAALRLDGVHSCQSRVQVIRIRQSVPQLRQPVLQRPLPQDLHVLVNMGGGDRPVHALRQDLVPVAAQSVIDGQRLNGPPLGV